MNHITYDQVSEQRPRAKPKPHFIRVLVFDIASGDQIREHQVNLSKVLVDAGIGRDTLDEDIMADKKLQWLLNMILWATLNGKTVEIISEGDWQHEQASGAEII